MSRSPFPKGTAAANVITGLLGALIGVWRCALYDFGPAGWSLALLAGVAGLLAPLLLPAGWRARLLAGPRAWLLVLPAFVFLTRIGGIPRPLTPAPLLFFSGAILGTALVVLAAVWRRERSIEQAVRASGDLDDPTVRAYLARYFERMGPLRREGRERGRALQQALRPLLRDRQDGTAGAVAALQAEIEFIDRFTAAGAEEPCPASLRPIGAETHDANMRFRAACVDALHVLETDGRLDPRSHFKDVSSVVGLNRVWHCAMLTLARGHRVRLPKWFCDERCELARAGFTPADLGGADPAMAAVSV
jgi:hypothetical protein